jgi:hypothetical protein
VGVATYRELVSFEWPIIRSVVAIHGAAVVRGDHQERIFPSDGYGYGARRCKVLRK